MSTDQQETDDEIELSYQSHDILRTALSHDGQLTVTETWQESRVEDNEKVKYRVRNELFPAGLAKMEQPDPTNGVWPPKIITLTEDGMALARRLGEGRDSSTGSDTLSDRVEELRATVDTLDERVDSIAERLSDGNPTERGPDEWDDGTEREFQEFKRGLRGMRQYLVAEHGAELSEWATETDQFEEFKRCTLELRDYLLSEHDADLEIYIENQ